MCFTGSLCGWQLRNNSGVLQCIACTRAVLAALIGVHGPARKLLPTTTDSAFHALANVVVSQQLSIHAAKNISDRLATAAGVRARLLYCLPVILACFGYSFSCP